MRARQYPDLAECRARCGRKRGFVIVAVTLSLLTLLGITGLAIDIGRMYTARNEGQTFADVAALRAAMQLNGSDTGIDAAVASARATPKAWDFGNRAFAAGDVEIGFGETRNGAFDPVGTAKTSPSKYWFTQVTVSMPVRMWFLPVTGTASDATVRAQAVAGLSEMPGFVENLMPMAPFTNVDICPGCGCADDPYMLCKGRKYTLRWPSNAGNASLNGADQHEAAKTVCQGDNWLQRLDYYESVSSEREFVVEQSAAAIKDIIETGVGLPPISIGELLDRTNGGKNSAPNALGTRVANDTDTASATYAAYRDGQTGNGQRVINVPVLDKTNHVAGFAAFFLYDTADHYTGTNGNQPVCAEYIGGAIFGNPFSGGTGPGTGGKIYELRLYQ